MKLISILVIVNLTLLGLWYPDRYPMLDFPIFRKIKSGDVAMVGDRDPRSGSSWNFRWNSFFFIENLVPESPLDRNFIPFTSDVTICPSPGNLQSERNAC